MLSIRNLHLRAATPGGSAHILRGIDLDIPRGRIIGVVGESGSGKSSLALCLLRLLPSNITELSGGVTMAGIELLGLTEDRFASYRGGKIAMIFQDPMTALNPVFTIGTQLVDVARNRFPELDRKTARARGEAMLERVGIADPALRMNAYPHQLSGGMRQRVMIAMALLVQPDLLLADEPTTALDATVEAQIVGLFESLRADFAGSILFISHHLGVVAQLCDEVVVMYGGHIVETGPVAAVCAKPHHPYTAALLACELDDEPCGGRLVSIAGDVPDPMATPAGCIFASRCTLAEPICFEAAQALRPLYGDRQVACWKAVA